ncbi:MAG: sulfatase-like hydrolase/transferase, partial [Rhodospirillales bacterium]|nr:sulfatase-like hydrolase/transferase [Rhodospirillales bacterium]
KLDLSGMDMESVEAAVARASASGKPVFLYAHYLPPHWPYKPPAPFNSKYVSNPEFELWNFRHDFWRIESLFAEKLIDDQHPEIRKMFLTYLNNTVYADYLLAETVRILKENNLYDDSLIIFTSDHGESFGLHGYPGHNNTVYADMIRVPLFVHYPGVTPRRVNNTVGLIDIFPTLNAMLEFGEDTANFEGRDLTPLLTGTGDFADEHYYLRAVIENVYGLQKGRLKYLFHQFHDYFYDLSQDPDELNNLFNQRPVLARWFRQQLYIYRHDVELGEGLKSKDVILEDKDREELENLGYIQ